MADVAGSIHGFPAALTSFVGRAAVVDAIAGQLGQYRLVTLTGPGAPGRRGWLARSAGQVAGRFADGVWPAVRDPAQVAYAVAALGIRDLPAVAPSEVLTHALARRRLLLVLDNCEHVIGRPRTAHRRPTHRSPPRPRALWPYPVSRCPWGLP